MIIAIVPYLCGSLFAQNEWQRSYGGWDAEQAGCIIQTSDSGFLVVGSTGSFGTGGGDVYLFKLDSAGVREWSTTFGGPGPEQGWSLRPLDDDGCILVGSTLIAGPGTYDGYMVRTDANGNGLWEKAIGTTEWEFLYDVEVLSDGFLAVGQTYATGGGDIWVVRTDLAGDTLWTRSHGDVQVDQGRCIRNTPDGGSIIAGTIGRADGTSDALLLKLDPFGVEEWRTAVGGDSVEVGLSVTILDDGNYLLAGYSTSYGPFRVMYLAKVDVDGTPMWENWIGGGATDWEGRSVLQDQNGSIVLAGYSKAFGAGGKDFYLLFADDQGNYLSGPTFGSSGDEEAWSVALTHDGGYVVAGNAIGLGPGPSAVFVVKTLGSTVNTSIVVDQDPLHVPDLGGAVRNDLYPNPVAPGATVHLREACTEALVLNIMDAMGRSLHTERLSPFRTTFALPRLSAGIYRVRMHSVNGLHVEQTLVVGQGPGQ